MHITILRLMAISTFISIATVSAMQQQKNNLSLELVTTRTHFNQFESNELQRLASTSKQFRNKVQKCFPQLWKNILDETGLCLFNRYLKDKDLHPDCIFLHCVYADNYDAVEWLLKNKAINPLCIFSSQGWPTKLNGYHVAHNRKNIKMIDLLEAVYLDEPTLYQLCGYHLLSIVGAACVGNQSLMRNFYNYPTHPDNIDLVICAAIKNKDTSLLKELSANEPFKSQMSISNDYYLGYVCTRQTFNPKNFDDRILCFRSTKEDVIFLKNLIESDCFKSTNALIDILAWLNQQQGNIGLFDEILDVLRSTVHKPCTIQ